MPQQNYIFLFVLVLAMCLFPNIIEFAAVIQTNSRYFNFKNKENSNDPATENKENLHIALSHHLLTRTWHSLTTFASNVSLISALSVSTYPTSHAARSANSFVTERRKGGLSPDRKDMASLYPGVHELSYEEPYLSRALTIHRECRKKSRRRHRLNTSTFKYSRKSELIFCETPKTASTTWQLLLLRLSGYQGEFTEEVLREWAHSSIPNKRFSRTSRVLVWKLVRSFTSFLVTRHPFERLVSAYYDKLSNQSTYKFYRQTVGVEMARYEAEDYLYQLGFSSSSLGDLTKGGVQASPEFKMLNQTLQKTVLKYIEAIETGAVSFTQLVRYILRIHKKRYDRMMDTHWRPQNLLCELCAFNYSYIIKFENIVEESNRLLEYVQKTTLKLPLSERIVFPEDKSKTDQAKTSNAIKQLSEEDVDKLRDLYKDDFVFFDYDPYLYEGY